MSARLSKLIARERDGELTTLEREELERLSRLDPVVRRDRAAWAEVERIIGAPRESVEFSAHRFARRISDQVRDRPVSDRPISVRVGSPWVFALAACFVLLAVSADRTAPSSRSRASVAKGGDAVVTVTEVTEPVASRSPVEVRMDGFGEPDAEPIEIQF